MSQEVDERVVKLSFDNAKFEKNVQQSIHSLNALNDSLRLEGAEKGFAEVEKASERVDFDRMQGAVETLSDKFSALEVIGVAALVKITNQAIDAGERLAKSLSIDQVTAGWNKYAEKTASVQTIMNATGKSIKQVNRYLDKLMWYSDETSYGFTDMTSALSTLTSSGGDIDKMIPMIMGMANATAYAGKGAAEFKRVIYNLSQSYGTGALQLIDWKSVENANVSSEQLKQTIIDTAVELGKIKKGEVTTGTFDNSLQKKWADREVMEQSFAKFSALTEAAYQAVQAGEYDSASEAIEALSKDYDELSVKAFKSAQSAKSFTDAIEATKDAVSSKWMSTFDIIFGNYKEAENFWTDVANTLYDTFAAGGDARNSWLKAGFDSGLDQLLDNTALGDVGDSFTTLLQKSLVDGGRLTSEGIDKAGSFQKALEEAGITAEELHDQVQMYLDVYKDAAKMSDEELAKRNVSRQTLEKTIAAYEKMAEEIQNGEVNLEGYADQMSRMSGREHFYAGILNILEGINSVLTPIRAAFNDVFMTDGSPLYNMLKGFDELTAKFQLSEESAQKVQSIFKGVFSVLSVGFKTIKTAGRIALALLEALLEKLQPLGDLLLSVGAAFGDIFMELNNSLNHAGSLEDVIDAIATAFGRLLQPLKDVFGALKALVTGSSIEDAGSKFGAFGKIISAVNGVFQNFGLGTISLSGLVGKALRVLGGIFFAAFDGVQSLIANAFGGFAEAGKAVEDFKDKNLGTLEEVRDTVVSLPEKASAALKAFAGNVQSSFYTVADACKTGLEAIQKFFHLEDGVEIYRLLALLDVGAVALAIWAVSRALNGMQKALKGVTDAAAKVLSNPVTDLLKSMKNAVDAWTKQHTTNNFVNIAKGISIAIGALSASIYMLSKIENPQQAAQALGSVIATLFALVVAMKALAKEDITGLDSAKIFATMISFSAGMLTFSASIKGLVKAMQMLKYFTKDQMNNAVGGLLAIGLVIGAMAGVIGGLNYASNKLTAGSKIKMANVWKGTSAYLVVATALLEVLGALYLLGSMDESKFQDAYGALFAMSIVMELMAGVIGGLNYANNKLQAASKNKLRGITEGASSFLVMAGALVIVAGAAKLFSTAGDLDSTMWAMLGTLTVMAAVVTLMSKFGGKARKMRSGAASMLVIGGALYIVAKALKTMHDAMAYDADGSGWAGLAVNLVLLGTAVGLLGKHAPESMAAAAAIAALGAAMFLMAEAIKAIADAEPENLISSVLAMTVALFGLVRVAAWIKPACAGILNVSGACLMLATALLLLTPAFKGLASLGIDQVIAGLAGTMGLLGAVWAIGANPAVSAGLVSLSASLIGLAKAFNVFVGGLVKLAGAAAIFSVLMLIADPVSQAIIEAEPHIEEALIALITGLCNVIIACAKPLGIALEALILTLIAVILDTISVLFTGESGLQGTITDGLDSTWNAITNWFGAHSLGQLFKDWVTGAAHALRESEPWFLKVDLNGPAGNAGEAFANWCDTILGPWFRKYVQKSWGLAPDIDAATGAAGRPNKEKAEAAKKQEQAEQDAADASGIVAKNVKDTADATLLTAKQAEDYADGLIDIVDSTGKIHKATAEQVKALQEGKITMADLQTAADDTSGAMNGLGEATDAINGKIQNGAAIARTCANEAGDSEKIVTEAGDRIEADAKELSDDVENTAIKTGDNATEVMEQKGDEAGSGWANHLVNAINRILGAFGIKLDTSKVEAGVQKVGEEISGLITPDDMLDPSKNSGSKTENKNGGKGLLGNLGDKVSETYNQLQEDALNAISDAIPDTTSTTSTGTGKTKTSSGKQKTVGEQIVEAYKAKLEANKLLRETADNEYALWKAENENTATADELMAKRAENAAKEIGIQSDRVALAQQKYDALLSKWGKEKTETKEAYNDLLQEKTSLAELKASQYTAIFEEADKLYDTNLTTLEKEYDLDSAKNERTATKKEKLDKETDYQKKRLDELEKKEENARKQWEYLTGEAGLAETDQRVIEAYQAYLEAQTDTQEVRNEIAEKQLEAIELEIEQLETAQKLATSHMEMLQKVYDDGDLSGRADAYKQAVETYGEDSKEARQARLQGTTSSILAAVSAVKNLNYQMQQTEELERKLAEAAAKDKDAIRQEVLDSKTAFLGFAENLADALNLNDSGKKAMLKVANGLQKNWKKLAQSMENVWNKATENNPQLAEAGSKMAKIMGDAFSETGMEIGTECVSTIVSLMQGDWANALASAFSLMLDLMVNEQVQDFMATLIADVGSGLNELGFNFTNLAKVAKNSMGSEGVAGQIAESTGMIEQAVQGSGGLEGILSNLGAMLGQVGSSIGGMLGDLGSTIVGFIGEFWPYILAGLAIVGALAGIAALFHKKKGSGSTSDEAKQAGVDYPTEYEKGIREGTPKVEQAVRDMTDTANDIALSAAQSIANVLDDDADYEPTIRPVVDLTEVADGVDEVNSAFAGEKPLTLDAAVSRRIASEADASPAIQNGTRGYSDANVLSAIGALGDHMDAVGESIRGMKMVVDGRKMVGYIDNQMGLRAARA